MFIFCLYLLRVFKVSSFNLTIDYFKYLLLRECNNVFENLYFVIKLRFIYLLLSLVLK